MGIAYDSNKKQIFVTSNGVISVINDLTNKVVKTIKGFNNAEGIAFDSKKNELFVANVNLGTVSVISDSTDKVVATVTGFVDPYNIAFDAHNGDVYVTNAGPQVFSWNHIGRF